MCLISEETGWKSAGILFVNFATHPDILSRGPPTTCQHCGQTLTIKHMLLECTVLQQNRDEYYTVDSLGTLFETIPEACIVEFLRETGFFYLIWMAIYPEQPLIQISHQAKRFWTRFNPSNTTRFCNLFIELNQLWENPTCEGRLICPGGHVSSLNKCNPIQSVLQHHMASLGHNELIC